jgi:hypothetical protein
VIVRLRISFIFLRSEEEVSSEHFVDHAGERPDVGGLVVIYAQNHFGRAILPGLDLRLEVVVRPAGVTKVCDFELELSNVGVRVIPE